MGPVGFEKLTVSAFDGATLSRRLSAGRLLVVPRQVGPLRIAGLHELVLTGVRYDVFLEEREPGPRRGADRKSILAEPVRPAVRVVAGSIHGLEWWASRGGEPVTRIDAVRARVDVRTGDVNLRGFRMVHLPSARSLEATRALWNERAREFVLAGEFVLHDGPSVLRGRGLRVDPELRVVGR